LPGNVNTGSGIMLINDYDLPMWNLTSFYESKMKNQWIIMSRKSFNFSVCHSRIDEPLYFYHNSTLFESYVFKDSQITRRLAQTYPKWTWYENNSKHFNERRGNFLGKTLKIMTGDEPYWTILPSAKDLKVSESIPDSYEVREKAFTTKLIIHKSRGKQFLWNRN
jgi:hypothetical protein